MQVIKPNTVGLTDGSFTRASTGTFTDIDGSLKTAAINIPRFNYDFGTGQFQGVLFEPAATNLATFSEDLTNAAWVKTNTTITANAINGPDGVLTADRVVDSAAGVSSVVRSFAVTSGTIYGASVFVKPDTYNSITLGFRNTNSAFVTTSIRINATTGAVMQIVGTPISTKVSKMINGYYRVEIVLAATATATGEVEIVISNSNNVETVGNGIYVWGFQFETTRVTSYIPTTTATVTRAADAVTGTNLLYSTATDPNALWSSATTYSLGQKVRYNNQVYESLQNTNLNRQPDTSPTFWLNLGYDNIHAQFDASTSTPTSGTAEITFLVKQASIDSIALINIDAFVIEVAVVDQTTGSLLMSSTYGLTGGNVVDWFQYFFFDPLTKRSQIVIPGIPSAVNSLITIRLKTSPGTPVSLGTYIGGVTTSLGTLQTSPSVGIIDYSRKETDEFGKTTFVQRAFSKRLSAEIWFDNTNLNTVQRYLTSIRATPVVWVGSTDPEFEEALVVYGFYRDFQTTIAYPQVSMCSLEIEGLT